MKNILIIVLVIVSGIHSAKAQHTDTWSFTNPASVAQHAPLNIAHRGGVVTPQTPECSMGAIKLAAEHNYDMVELDVRASADSIPFVFHDANLMEACGIDQEFSQLESSELQKITYSGTAETIRSLEDVLNLCEELGLGVMFDVKIRERNDAFFQRLKQVATREFLRGRAVVINGFTGTQQALSHIALTTVSDDQMKSILAGKQIDLSNHFWFGLPEHLPDDHIKVLKANKAYIIPALNYFRYEPETHLIDAATDARRLKRAGVHGFQIDSVYEHLFYAYHKN
ncbi:MAG: hypothetical protein GF372_07335 [Candidatus Marinimicrobia bacterium]|nr:hypothetical protein [Candidatus Neomarinimicrobiota bacterium]